MRLTNELVGLSKPEAKCAKKYGLPLIQYASDRHHDHPEESDFRTLLWLWELHCIFYWAIQTQDDYIEDFNSKVDVIAEDEAFRWVSIIYKHEESRKAARTVIVLLGYEFLEKDPTSMLKILADAPMA